MKKKPLLFALLALAIVTSLTAGTLAVYTKSVDLDTKVAVKKFAFTAAGTKDSFNKSISLAPKEKDSYSFTVSNNDGRNVSEVDLNCIISIDVSDAIARMTGLTVTLTGDGINTALKVGATGKLDHQVLLPKSSDSAQSTTKNYTVTLDWNGGTDAQHTASGENGGATAGLIIDVVATQATATTNGGSGA